MKRKSIFLLLFLWCLLGSPFSYSAFYKWAKIHFSDRPKEGVKIKQSSKSIKTDTLKSENAHQLLLSLGVSTRKKHWASY